MLASLAFLVHPWYEATRETADASIYLLCAKSILAGKGYSVLGEPFTVRPPGFSLLLAPLLAWRGLDFLALNLLVSLSGAAAVALFFTLVRPQLGAAVALALAALVWLNPTVRHLSNEVLSDLPGLAALLACLLVARWAERRPSSGRDAVLGITIGLATYVRAQAGLVLPAVWIARALADRSALLQARSLVLAAVAAAVAAPWYVRNALHHPPWPAEQTVNATYGALLWHADSGDPRSPLVPFSSVLARPVMNGKQLLVQLGSRLDADAWGLAPAILGGVLVAALVVLAARRKSVPAITGILVLAVLLLFPVAVEVRHVLPVWVLGAAATAEVLVLALGRRLSSRGASFVAAAAIVALALLDFAPRRGWSGIEAADRENREIAAAVASRLAPDDRVAAPVGWHWSLFLDRPVYNLHIQAQRMGTAGIDQVIRDRAIDAVVLRVDPPEAPNMTAYLESKHGAGEMVGPVRIVRIRK
jgi:4-amino-4-deoxy-L-arabinose transferase-like glycosyltransferase